MKVDARERSSPASSLRIRLLVGLAALLACGPCEAWQQTDTPASQCAGVLRSIPHALVTEAWGVEAAATRVLDLLDCSGITVRVPAPGDAAAANALPSFPEVRLEEAHASVIGSLATLLQDMPRDHAHLVPPLRELLQVARGRLIWELRELAAEQGDPGAQGEQAIALAYGLTAPPVASRDDFGPLQEPQIPRAMLSLYFAAAGNDSLAAGVLGHRHRHGVGAPQSCPTAVLYYQKAAEQVIQLAAQTEHFPAVEWVRLSTAAGSGRWGKLRDADVLHFYQNSADLGSSDAARMVGNLLSQGGGGVRDQARAVEYYERAAAMGDHEAMAQLGHMFAAGTEIRQDNETAVQWFLKSVEIGDGAEPSASGLLGLGYMYMMGHGVERDHKRALQLLTAASGSQNSDAQFNLGVMHLNGWGMLQPQPERAFRLFSLAAASGHLLALYNLAMMQLSGQGPRAVDCKAAVKGLAKVANRGSAMRHFARGVAHFRGARYDAALFHFLVGADLGVDAARANAAWLLDQGLIPPSTQSAALALRLHTMAKDDSHEARLALGDAHYYGFGVPHDAGAAAAHYRAACPPSRQSAPRADPFFSQAAFNMGYLHQHGIGVVRDLHLAKRYYDQSLLAMPEARWAVRLAFISLRAAADWDWLAERAPALAASVHTPLQHALDWASHHARRAVDPVYALHNRRAPPTTAPTPLQPPDAADGTTKQPRTVVVPEDSRELLSGHKSGVHGGRSATAVGGGSASSVDGTGPEGAWSGWTHLREHGEASLLQLLTACVCMLLVLRAVARFVAVRGDAPAAAGDAGQLDALASPSGPEHAAASEDGTRVEAAEGAGVSRCQDSAAAAGARDGLAESCGQSCRSGSGAADAVKPLTGAGDVAADGEGERRRARVEAALRRRTAGATENDVKGGCT